MINHEKIVNILVGRTGAGMPDRGVGPDDILLGKYAELPDNERDEFWNAFGNALREIWQKRDVNAMEYTAAFISGLSVDNRPTENLAKNIAEFLCEDILVNRDASEVKANDRRQVIAALRILACLKLGDRKWWCIRFYSWLHDAKSTTGLDGQMATQAVLHASRGWMNGGQGMPNFDAWFEYARMAKEFPAIELFAVLADQADHQSDKEHLKSTVINVYQSLYAVCYDKLPCSTSIEDLRKIIETWLRDRMHVRKNEAEKLLQWREPDKLTPKQRLYSGSKIPAELSGAHS